MLEITNKHSSIELMPTRIGNIDGDAYEPESNDDDAVLNINTLEKWLMEIRDQPRWRLVADKEMDYYDGNQIDAETAEAMAERGQAPIIDNMIQPTINAVLGMQVKSRQDTKVAPEAGETNTDVADALSLTLKHYAQEARADRAKSDAHAEQIKVGISWLEVARNTDPFKPRVRYQHINRREIFWDWRAKEPDLSDARYIVRRKWMDEDVLLQLLPDQAGFIKAALSGRQNWDMDFTGAEIMGRGVDSDLTTGFNTSIEQFEWMNTTRRRLCVYEVWYKVSKRGQYVKMPNGRVVDVETADFATKAAIMAGILTPMNAVFDKPRVAFWIGPKLISDRPSPYRHRHYPYVPLFGFREDRTGIPYGLIRAMVSPQDEINHRKSKMLWLLSAKRVIATENAVIDHNNAAKEVARPDAYIIKSNKPGESFEVIENSPMAKDQFMVMQEAKETIQTSVGVHNSTLGRDSGATSGLAINSLVEQDSITLAELNDNFNMGCRLADELLLSLVIEDLSDTEDERVTLEDDFGNKREVILNQKAIDPMTGAPIIINDVTKVNVSVVLENTPSTPTFRNQQLNQLAEVIKAMPPQAQAAIMPDFIMATELPKRSEMAEKIAAALGVNFGGGKDEDPAISVLRQQVDQLKAELERKQPESVTKAQVDKLMAEVEKIKADTVSIKTTALYSQMQTAQAVAANPAIVPIADSVGKSVGFVDANGGSIVDTPVGNIPDVGVNAIPSPPHTNPLTPALPASPAAGVNAGIEQQGNQI